MRGTPGNPQVDTLRALIALSEGSGVTASSNDFVYQPGGVAHGNVHTDWPTLITAVNLVAGVRRILIDPTFAGITGPTVPAGTWSVDNVQFYGKVPSTGFFPSLTFNDGAHLTANSLYFQNLIVQLDPGATTPVMTFAGGVGCVVEIYSGAIFGNAAAPFFRAATDSGTCTLAAISASFIGDGTNPIFEANGAANV